VTHHERYPTPYLEANLVLAEQQRDDSQVEALLAELLPNERIELAEACYRLARKLRASDSVTVLHWDDNDEIEGAPA
jgi:hypothetical protein